MQQTTQEQIQNELISRVSALDGKQHQIETNRQSLSATIDALKECTSVDPEVIGNIADQLSVKSEYVVVDPPPLEASSERNTRYAVIAAKVLVVLFVWSIFKWFVVSGKIKQVMHDTSVLQSQIADFQLRTGQYPYTFDQLRHNHKMARYGSVESIEMGPKGALLIETNGIMKTTLMLVPEGREYGPSKWNCTTNESRFFMVTKWLCQYGSMQFRS